MSAITGVINYKKQLHSNITTLAFTNTAKNVFQRHVVVRAQISAERLRRLGGGAMCWVDACIPATRLNIDRWLPAARQICSDEVPTLAQRSASIIYTIILLMDTVSLSPSTLSVALIFGLYRPSSGPIALRNVLKCSTWHTFFTIRFWHFSSAAFIEKSAERVPMLVYIICPSIHLSARPLARPLFLLEAESMTAYALRAVSVHVRRACTCARYHAGWYPGTTMRLHHCDYVAEHGVCVVRFQKEYAIPEQFKTRWNGKKLVTLSSDINQ